MKIKLLLFVSGGWLCLLLGFVGLFLPVWPTTPFVLCAAGCFAHTPRLHGWLMKTPIFRDYIESYQSHRGLPRKTVVISLLFLWGMLGGSIFLIQHTWLRALLFCIGLAVTAHILWIARRRAPEKKR